MPSFLVERPPVDLPVRQKNPPWRERALARQFANSKKPVTGSVDAHQPGFRVLAGDRLTPAKALGVSISTVEREWTYARAWLLRELAERDDA